MLIFAVGQFILVAVLGTMSFNFYRATKNSADMESKLAENCAAIHDTLKKVDEVYAQSDTVVEKLTAQLYHIGKDLDKTGKRINRIFPKNGDSLIGAGQSCYDTSKLLHQYRIEVAPSIRASLSTTADSVELTGKTLSKDQPYTRASQQMLILSASFIVICFINALAMTTFAFCKGNDK